MLVLMIFQLHDLKENTDKTTAKFEEANLQLEQVQEINKNKHSQNEAYIERSNHLNAILSTLNEDTAKMLLDKNALKDREIKLKQVCFFGLRVRQDFNAVLQDAIESSSIYEVEKQNQEAEIESLKSEIEMIWNENMKMESERLRLRVKIEDDQNAQIIKMENSKRFINLLEAKISTLVDSHFMPDGDHPNSNSSKPPE